MVCYPLGRKIPIAISIQQPSNQWSMIAHDQGIEGGIRAHSTLEDDLGESRHLVFVDLAGQDSLHPLKWTARSRIGRRFTSLPVRSVHGGYSD